MQNSKPSDKNAAPTKAVVILLDSLNRHMIGNYGGREFETPNIDRFAKTAVRFNRHFTGSLPCMPARHDILCGALDFLWKPWGSIELWEEPITANLRRDGVTTMLISDHPHLFETGGENYHTDFYAWEYLRGHEGDPWKSRPDPSWIGAPALPANKRPHHYDETRTWFREELDFPGPKTMHATSDWLDVNGGHFDRFLLFVDEFDPHEPFDTPAPWLNRYDDTWQGETLIWPPYAIKAVEKGVVTEREARHIRCNYGSKLSMIDHWFGKVLDAMDRGSLWDDTMFILCTDHGHYLGEKDLFGKPGVPQYEPLGHTPLYVYYPGIEPHEVDALTTNVDINATLCDFFAVQPGHRTHGESLLPLIQKRQSSIREWALGGVFGNWVQVYDGTRKYARAPAESPFPLSLWSNRWSTMPIQRRHQAIFPKPDRRARIDFMPGSDVPVLRQPFEPGDTLPYWCAAPRVGEHHLYDISIDPDEDENRLGGNDEAQMIELLREGLNAVGAPDEQFERLGIV
ncbi:MAG: sulfatase [Gammaproteobacteria bacterium]|nr:sulfatase [Gammaproteobacteria bacterium]